MAPPGAPPSSDAEAATVAEVIARLRALSTPRGDGIAEFARLYLRVTEGVNAELAGQAFLNPPFLTRLDVAFGNLFLQACAAFERDPATAPKAWAPLFETRSRRGIAPIQFAVAGMNAHINRDLPVALVGTCSALALEPRDHSPEHTDFETVNRLLAVVEARLKRTYVKGWLAVLSRVLHPLGHLDDVLAMWDVARARDAAWTNGEALWKLRDTPDLASAFLLTLDRTVGMASRGLLVPTRASLFG
ncbi:MAG TPA: DUF5995 family protein [Gaiellaceae bacterium]